MKKISSLVTLLLLLLLIGCNKTNEHDKELIPLKIELLDLIEKEMPYISSFSVSQGKIYIVGMENIYIDLQADEKPVTKVLTLDFAGNILSETEINNWLRCTVIDSEGFIWALEYESIYSGSGDGLILNCYDITGEHIKSINISGIDSRDVELTNHNTFAIDNDGNIYLRSFETELIDMLYERVGGGIISVFDKTGKLICDIETLAGHKNHGIYRLPDGKIITYEHSLINNWDYFFREVDIESKSLINKVDFNWKSSGSGSLHLFSGSDMNYDLLYYDLKTLYGYNLSTGISEELLNWSERDILNFMAHDYSNLPRIAIINNDIYLISIENGRDGSPTSVILNKIQLADPVRLEQSSRKEVKLAALQLDQKMIEVINEFNISQDEYLIKTEVYSNDLSFSYDNELILFNMDLAAENGPDIVLLNDVMPVESYINKGVFADLYTFIDNDHEISRIDYLENILTALERNGKLYTIAPLFSISTLAGKTADVGINIGWNWDEYNALLKQKPDDIIPIGYAFAYFSQTDFLNSILFSNMSNYLDYSEMKASFDSPDFIGLLETAAKYPVEGSNISENSFRTGNPLLLRIDFSMFDNFRIYENYYFGEEISFVGFPSNSGRHTAGRAEIRFAITANASEKDGAWAFARYLLTDYQDTSGSLLSGNGLPIRLSSLERLAKAAKVKPVNGEPRVSFIYDGQEWIPVEIGNHTDEDNKKIFDLISMVTTFTGNDQQLVNIINEEAGSFFAGQKSAEEVAAIIQNRVNVYLAELE
ncbi:MAG: hypothetical protein FWG91_02670 [Lachnospiraceae bacterium]|nr:hypothetical protein [Lachnospiraceae bacterium]